MNNRQKLCIGILMMACSCIIPGCTLDDPDHTDDSPALTLFAVQNFSVTNLTWDKVNVTGFKEYIILQSSSDIPDNPTPAVTADVIVIKRIKDVNVTSFSAASVPTTPTICYKLYCAVDDRFLYSATNCLTQDLTILNGFYDRAYHEAGNDQMVLFDRVNDQLSTYNYRTNSITHTISETVLNFPSLQLSTWNNITYLFGFDQSPSQIIRYNYPSLVATQLKNYSQFIWSAKAFSNFVFVTSENNVDHFQVLDRNNLNVLDGRIGISGNQNIAVFGGDTLTVLTLGNLESKKYLVNMNGKVVEESLIPGRVTQPDVQSVCAEGSELFIGGHQGSIVNRIGENVGSLAFNTNSFILINRLSPDEMTAVYLANDLGNLRLEFADISNLPTIIKTISYDVPALQYGDLFVEDGVVYLIGASFNSQAQTFILKYPM